MGSEGYLINQFLAERVNRRDDEWGGTPGETPPLRRRDRPQVREPRSATTSSIIYRMSLLDLVEGGQTWDEVRRAGPGHRGAPVPP